jgi:uncharacterized protein (DUF952 family)
VIRATRIYHLAPAERWSNWPAGKPYLPAEYDNDGFIHCTAGEELMLKVANSFYRQVPGDFVLLTLDVERLRAPLRWEAPDHPSSEGARTPAGDHSAPLFPHLYGPIESDAIMEVHKAERAPDGSFISWGAR